MPFIGISELMRRKKQRQERETAETKPQKLVLPMKDSRQVVGYKNREYAKYWGFPHYGWDFNSSEPTPYVYALGNGTVAAAGKDRLFGWCCVVVYPNCWLRKEHRAGGITCRYYHLRERPFVKPGQQVDAQTVLAIMGNTGKYTSGPHLHITLDRDTAHPCYEPGIARNGEIIKRGIDTTIDPADVLYIDRERQVLKSGALEGWNSPGDYLLPDVKEE